MRTEKDEEEGVDGEGSGVGGGVSKDVRRSDVSGYRIHPSHPSNHPLLGTDRASGQSEITLSPSRCVQSKLQFKSSCQTLVLSSSRYSPPPLLSRSPGLLFRHPELEIPKIVLHRPPTNFAMPRVCVRSTLFYKCVHCSSVFACTCVIARTSERMNKLVHDWIEKGRSKKSAIGRYIVAALLAHSAP